VACKLLDIPEGKFDQVKWTPLNTATESAVTWQRIKHTNSRNFTIQEYKGYMGVNYRVVARQPKSDRNVIEIATSNDLNQLKEVMNILAEIDCLSDFNYQNFWNRINTSTTT